MNAVEIIRAAQQRNLVDVDEEPVSIELKKPLTPAEIDQLETDIAAKLPREVRDVLGFCSKIECGHMEIDFINLAGAFGMEEVFSNCLPICGDGFGNFWVVDLTEENEQSAPIYYACHDAPIILFQSENLADFLATVFLMFEPSSDNPTAIKMVSDDPLEIWRKNPGLISVSQALQSPDPALREFAGSLRDDFQIIDLRNAPVGMGFSWGRYGPETEVKRFGKQRIFAYAKPLAATKRGFLKNLFGGSAAF